MKNKYEQWIAENTDDVIGKCEDVTKEMQEVFPELYRVRGFYHCSPILKREHWWLKDKNGKIIDPTKKQFISDGGTYEEWNEGAEEPSGKCLNCGDYCYKGSNFCKSECYDEFVKSLGN